MEEINKRFVLLRKELGLSQRGLGDSIGLSNSGVSNIENGIRSVTDQHIRLLQSEFNVNADWLRTGEGKMFVQSETFSFDEQVKKSNLTELETAIMRGYMELSRDTREEIVSMLEGIILQRKETATTVELTPEQVAEKEAEAYRQEILAELKGATLSVSAERKEDYNA